MEKKKIPTNLMIKSFKTDGTGHTVTAVEIYNDDGTTFMIENDSEQSSKSVTITTNGDITINPDEGYNAMNKVVATVEVPNKLYCWMDSNNTLAAYTFVEEPEVGDKAYIITLTGLDENEITAVVAQVITADSTDFSRHLAGDITIE